MRKIKALTLRKECLQLTKGTSFFRRLYKAAKRAYNDTPRNLRVNFQVSK